MWSLYALLLIISRAEGGPWYKGWLLSGKCPDPDVQEAFDINKYLGIWYEIAKNPTIFQTGRCTQATYSLKSNGKMDVQHEEILSDGTVRKAESEAYPSQGVGADPAKMRISYFWLAPSAPYWVLSTDYDNYALVYSCLYFPFHVHTEYLWILSRKRQLSPDIMQQLNETLKSNNINVDNLKVSDQSMCSDDL
ncbi:apolipoprotein D [Ambystoma mexicanum]|uniref:apolipoprotein D n=1 Tax=Ambystoma mexicanum TaxID=8296 RepID=UPI0037E99B1B